MLMAKQPMPVKKTTNQVVALMPDRSMLPNPVNSFSEK
jgi:hypothetical protein